MTIGERLKMARKFRNRSQEEIGSMVGLKKSAISHIEKDLNRLSTDKAMVIGTELGVNASWLLTGEGEMTEPFSGSVGASFAANKTINQRIEALINTLEHGNKSAFSNKIGTSSGVIGDIVGGRLNSPSFGVLEKIAKTYPNINPTWLLTGGGEMNEYSVTTQSPDKENEWLRKALEDKDIIIAEKDQRIHELKEMIDLLRTR